MGFDGMGQGQTPFSPIKQGFSQPWCLASVQCAVGVFLYGLRLSVVRSYIQRGGTECIYTEGHDKPTSSQRSEENLGPVGNAWKKWRCLLCAVLFGISVFILHTLGRSDQRESHCDNTNTVLGRQASVSVAILGLDWSMTLELKEGVRRKGVYLYLISWAQSSQIQAYKHLQGTHRTLKSKNFEHHPNYTCVEMPLKFRPHFI